MTAESQPVDRLPDDQVSPQEQQPPRTPPAPPPADRNSRHLAAETAAREYATAVRATESFVAGLADAPTRVDLARYTALQERENAAWQQRREAFAALGLHHEPQIVENAW
jgi:hypothetical protein